MGNLKSKFIALVTFLGGVYYFLDFILPPKLPEILGGVEFGKYNAEISRGFIAIGAMAFALGLINLIYVHGSKIVFLRKGFLNSLALLVSLVLMMLFTANEWLAFEAVNNHAKKIRNLALFSKQIKVDYENKIQTVLPVEQRIALLRDEALVAAFDSERRLKKAVDTPEITRASFDENHKTIIEYATGPSLKVEKLDLFASALIKFAVDRQQIEDHLYKASYSKKLYDFLYEGFFVPLGSAMFALLGFYIISAGYRAFRVRSVESGLMMVAAVVVMLGQIPFYIYISDLLPEFRLWLLEVPSAAAFRAIKFGAAIAGLYMAIRMWLSIESSSFIDKSSQAGGGK
jgi:hypothetical protein